jgi:hypothetical protein
MSLPTNLPETPASPSLTAATPGTGLKAPALPLPAKLLVRRKSEPLSAVLNEAETGELTLADGRTVLATKGHYIIRRGALAVTVLQANQIGLGRDYEPVQDALTLSPDQKQRLEATLGFGATRTAPDLVTAVERLASISIGTIRVEFTPGQLEEIAHRAKKRGHTVQQELEAAVDRIKGEIFHRGA